MTFVRIAASLAFVACTFFGTAAQAQRTTYDLTLTIDRIDQTQPCAGGTSGFGCLGLGNSFQGSFSVDSSILALDGLNQTAAIYDFYLPFGALVYSTGPLNTALAAFRNPGLGATAPGFVIEGGQVADFFGGLYSAGDAGFIDMYGYGPQARNRFFASDQLTQAYGTLTIASAAPEPETYAMMVAGLLVVGVAARRRRTTARSS